MGKTDDDDDADGGFWIEIEIESDHGVAALDHDFDRKTFEYLYVHAPECRFGHFTTVERGGDVMEAIEGLVSLVEAMDGAAAAAWEKANRRALLINVESSIQGHKYEAVLPAELLARCARMRMLVTLTVYPPYEARIGYLARLETEGVN